MPRLHITSSNIQLAQCRHVTICLDLSNLSPYSHLSPSELKIGEPVTPVLGNVHTNFGVSMTFSRHARSPCRTIRQTWGQSDRQTDRQTGKTRNAA